MPMPPETTGLFNDEDFLLERLSALVEEIDPVPESVIDDARAAFGPSAERSQPRRRDGAAIEPGLLGLAELLGPSIELSSLTGRAAADVPGVPAESRFAVPGDRLRGPARRATKVDLHTA